jgi:hypothetical protein
MATNKGRRYPLLFAAAALGSILSAAPAQAAQAPSHISGAAYHCYTRFSSGHWIWVNGHRTWVPGRYVRVCGR